MFFTGLCDGVLKITGDVDHAHVRFCVIIFYFCIYCHRKAPPNFNIRLRGKYTTERAKSKRRRRKIVIKDRLDSLRRVMKEKKIDYYLVPTEDPHGSEYVGEYYKCREYLTGFRSE